MPASTFCFNLNLLPYNYRGYLHIHSSLHMHTRHLQLRKMGIYQLPREIITSFFEFAVLSASCRDTLNSGMTIKLAQVNRLFRLIVVNMPVLWGTISNKQAPEMLNLCLERSKQSLLRVVLLLDDRGTDSYKDFLKAVAVHSSRWEEFYFETGSSLSDYLLIIHDLPNHCHDLQLPQLRTLTLLYPDPSCYDTDAIDPSEVNAYTDEVDQSRNHFYSSWTTPKLQRLMTRNTIPYHTRGAKLTTCEIESDASCNPDWRAEPLLSMYPHWARLKSLTLRCREDILYTEEPPSMDTVVLPLLENLSLSFPAMERIYYQSWLLDVLDFSNVLNIDIRFSVKKSEYLGGKLQYAESNVRALFRDQSNYSRLEQLKFSLSCLNSVFFDSTFKRGMDASILFATFDSSDTEAGPFSPDPLGIESIVQCAKEVTVFLRRQSGWEGLSEMTIVRGTEEKAERIRAAFPGWSIHHRSNEERYNLEAWYKYMDDGFPWLSIGPEGRVSLDNGSDGGLFEA